MAGFFGGRLDGRAAEGHYRFLSGNGVAQSQGTGSTGDNRAQILKE
jgi:hypothetical protein